MRTEEQKLRRCPNCVAWRQKYEDLEKYHHAQVISLLGALGYDEDYWWDWLKGRANEN